MFQNEFVQLVLPSGSFDNVLVSILEGIVDQKSLMRTSALFKTESAADVSLFRITWTTSDEIQTVRNFFLCGSHFFFNLGNFIGRSSGEVEVEM